MQIAKAFFLTIKENRNVIIIYLSVFVVLELMMVHNGDSTKGALFQSSQVSLVVQDQDQSVLSRGLTEYLSGLHQVEKKSYSQEEIADGLYYESIDYALILPKGFGERLANGEKTKLVQNQKRKGSTSGQFVDIQIEQYLALLQSYLTAGYAETDAVKAAIKASQQKPEITMLDTSAGKTGESKLYTAFRFMPYILICILMVGLGSILTCFQEKNILTRLCCSALSTLRRNIQLGICSGIFAIFAWFVFLVVILLFSGKEIFCFQGCLYLINSFCFLLVALSLTLVTCFLIHSDYVLNMVANVVGLGLSFLGGIYVPLEVMSATVVKYARLLPSYWYTVAMEQIADYTGTAEQWKTLSSYFGIQVLFAVAIGCAAFAVSRYKRR